MSILLTLLLLALAGQGLATSLRNQIQSLVGQKLTSSLPIVAKINKVDGNGRSAMHYAAMFGDLALVEFLVSHDAEMQTADNDGLLPLDYAISETETSNDSQRMLIVSHILEMTYGVNGRDEKGWLPINWAMIAGDLQRVKELIDKGTESRYLYNKRSDPFKIAILMQNDELIKLLVAAWGIDIVVAAFFNDDLAQFKIALDELAGNLNIADKHGETALHKVALYGATEFAELLIGAGAEVNVTNDLNETPLGVISYYGSREGRKETAELLIKAGAIVDAPDCYNRTPLHVTSKYGHIEFAQLLLGAGAMVNAVDRHGQTPLHMVSRLGCVELAKVLLEAGAMVNAIDEYGQTPMHLAVRAGIIELIELYLEVGAEITIIDKDGNSPLDYAKKKGQIITDLLLEYL